ncbi:MAG: hypothetical protein M3442_19560 [Chloroflexota bacterium]|nr:hypothetical protein [Chloroflexota bacterium]
MTTGPHGAAAIGKRQADGPRPPASARRVGHRGIPREGIARLRWLLLRLTLGGAVLRREEAGRQQSILAQARLEGALLVVRTVAHEVNNDLAPIAGFAELLALRPAVAHDSTAIAYARQIHVSALAAAATVLRLQRLVRLEEAPSALGGGWSVLDLERSTAPDGASPPAP